MLERCGGTILQKRSLQTFSDSQLTAWPAPEKINTIYPKDAKLRHPQDLGMSKFCIFGIDRIYFLRSGPRSELRVRKRLETTFLQYCAATTLHSHWFTTEGADDCSKNSARNL